MCLKTYDKLIFLGNGNTVISPMAEAVLQDKFKLEDILVESKGLIVLFPEPINPKAEEVLESNGLNMAGHTSVAFTENDFDDRTLVLTLSMEIRDKALADFGDKARNVYDFCTFAGAEDRSTILTEEASVNIKNVLSSLRLW